MNKSIGVLLARVSAVVLATLLGILGFRKLVLKQNDNDDYYDYLIDREDQKNDEIDSVELHSYL